MENLTFCFLDGDHSSKTIQSELGHLWGQNMLTGKETTPWMNPKGIVVVDNVECDPDTTPHLKANFNAEIRDGTWAVVRGRKC